jgi:hypothetical protein
MPELPAKPEPEPVRATAPRRPAPSPAPQPSSEDSRTSAPPGPSLPVPGQLSAALSQDAALSRKFTTAQLLEATEHNLKGLTRSLNGDEQAVLRNIRSYVQQARSATDIGDVERAYNLALKAHLLSDELVKR